MNGAAEATTTTVQEATTSFLSRNIFFISTHLFHCYIEIELLLVILSLYQMIIIVPVIASRIVDHHFYLPVYSLHGSVFDQSLSVTMNRRTSLLSVDR